MIPLKCGLFPLMILSIMIQSSLQAVRIGHLDGSFQSEDSPHHFIKMRLIFVDFATGVPSYLRDAVTKPTPQHLTDAKEFSDIVNVINSRVVRATLRDKISPEEVSVTFINLASVSHLEIVKQITEKLINRTSFSSGNIKIDTECSVNGTSDIVKKVETLNNEIQCIQLRHKAWDQDSASETHPLTQSTY